MFGKVEGSPRRCGGQGDITAGALGVFYFWAKKLVFLIILLYFIENSKNLMKV